MDRKEKRIFHGLVNLHTSIIQWWEFAWFDFF